MRWALAGRRADSELFAMRVDGEQIEVRCIGTQDAIGHSQRRSRTRSLSRILNVALNRGARTVIVDLEPMGDVNTTLLAALVQAKRQARRMHSELIVKKSPALDLLAEVCGLEEVLAERT